MTEQELLTALRHCVKGTCRGCPLDKPPGQCSVCAVGLLGYASDATEHLMAKLETANHQLKQVRQERDAWKLRAEAAERDINKVSILYPCAVCKHGRFGTCTLAANLDEPRWRCNRDTNRFEWRGPCKENGGDTK